MIKRDGPVGALNTYPNCRRQSTSQAQILAPNQLLIGRLSMLHNHPSGDPTPSQADIQMTRQIIEIAKPLGIEVHDHIIVGKAGHASLKGLKLI